MLWALGFWMMGTLAMFAVILTARQKSGASIYLLILSLAAIALAVYFTPLSRFTNLFPTQASLILPASIGAFNLLTSWLIAFRLRNKIVEPQIY
jgi:disulfide bond formation protein DsbB